MDEANHKLSELLEIREQYLKIARNDESLNDQIRELQDIIHSNKTNETN